MVNKSLRTEKGKIYSLSGPDSIPFYVGCTVLPMSTRLAGHINDAKIEWNRGRKCEIIRGFGFKITATILEIIVVDGIDGYAMNRKLIPAEEKWIAKLIKDGHPLVNRPRGMKREIDERVGMEFKTKVA